MRTLAALLAGLQLFAVLAAPAVAQDFQKGHEAYLAGAYSTALREWQPLADAGDATAQLSMGVLYYYGRGVKKDFAEALRWYRLSAEQGHLAAQVIIGVMHFEGNGAEQNYTEALRWFRVGAAQNNVFAQNALGVMHRDGLGVALDFVQAHMWFDLAAAQGDAEAIKNRDALAPKLTPGYLGRARRMAREWRERHLQ